SLQKKYTDIRVAVPEHFIWLVAEQLCLAIAWLHFGERPDIPGHRAPGNWTTLYHRDIGPHNIFIQYRPRRPGRLPAAVEESNAFPQIVLGDFGMGALTGDVALRGEDAAWEDVHGVGLTLRYLCQAHLPVDKSHVGAADYGNRRPDNIEMTEINVQDGSAPDLSNELINLLGMFEWDDMDTTSIYDMEPPEDAMGATSRWMVDTLYPAARLQVAAYRNPPGGRPAGYFDELDVSWTRPEHLMPFVYVPRYAHLARDGGPRRDKDSDEVARMNKLAVLHQLDGYKPGFELRSIEFNRPTIQPLKIPPHRADSDSDADGEDESDADGEDESDRQGEDDSNGEVEDDIS
ncbi:hypothetical protein F5883DRAFT_702909, partial [Diaporthe sp. PMI_573]